MPDRTDPMTQDGADDIAAPHVDAAGIDLLGTQTAQVAVTLPVEHQDDDLVEDDPAPMAATPGVTAMPMAAAPGVTSAPEDVHDAVIVEDEPERPLTRPGAAPTGPASGPESAPAPVLRRHHTETSPVTLTAVRVGEREADRETPDLLTDGRLVERTRLPKTEPSGAWPHLLYTLSGRRINLGDSRKARERKALDARIAVPLDGRARFVAVLSRKGGVGKTTVTTLLGMALADAREDRVIAVDANPDRGTLADRIGGTPGKTVRDLSRARAEVHGFTELSAMVARDHTRLDVLASDADPRVSDAFSDDDYRDVAELAAHYYSIVLTDTGTGIVHSVMDATLDAADAIVIVAGLSVDEARLASETLTWLETNGYTDLARRAVVVLNTSRPGTPLVRAAEVEEHFRSRVRAVVRLPYDALVAAGGAIAFAELERDTRQASRELAATVVEGLSGSAVTAA
ncbi:MAG: MinD/ParA family protein [Microbacterium sp.]|uniref:MinD/ParA family ATP-binding protein n=1 Tax=Microbacterium sp. TaxID=51671 RepID=UPI00261FE5EF|nr:MinD/ParA family protein [Microbacterium sp.]MCX6502258.1 MinD/ParA family protein [Microbacterium sp.]